MSNSCPLWSMTSMSGVLSNCKVKIVIIHKTDVMRTNCLGHPGRAISGVCTAHLH